MNRRNAVLGLVALGAVPITSFAQHNGKVWRVGFLSARSRPASLNTHFYSGFVGGMRDLGYVEGKNLVIEWRFADNKVERLSPLITELIQLKVDVLVTAGTQTVRALQKETATIPIVMASVTHPVESGLIKSLAQPGGNTTGLSTIAADISPKLLELLRSVVPKLSHVVLLVNPDNSTGSTYLKNIQIAAQRSGVTVGSIEARTPQEIESAFIQGTFRQAGALIVPRNTFYNQQVRQIAELAAKNRLPSIGGILEFVEAGGLMSYGTNVTDLYRRAATYVDKIFKGIKPADLPVEQPIKFELAVNLRTAKSLGLSLPQSILLRADRVIE